MSRRADPSCTPVQAALPYSGSLRSRLCVAGNGAHGRPSTAAAQIIERQPPKAPRRWPVHAEHGSVMMQEWGLKLAAVVSAPSATREPRAGAKRCPFVATGSQRFGARAPYFEPKPSGA